LAAVTMAVALSAAVLSWRAVGGRGMHHAEALLPRMTVALLTLTVALLTLTVALLTLTVALLTLTIALLTLLSITALTRRALLSITALTRRALLPISRAHPALPAAPITAPAALLAAPPATRF